MNDTEEKDVAITLTIPGRLIPLLDAAAREIDVTVGTIPPREALLLHLIERGAREVKNYVRSADYRPLSSLCAAELADMMGILDIEATRRSVHAHRETQERIATEAIALFDSVKGLRQVGTKRRTTSGEEVLKLANHLAANMREHPTMAIVIAFAYVDTEDGVTFSKVDAPADQGVH